MGPAYANIHTTMPDVTGVVLLASGACQILRYWHTESRVLIVMRTSLVPAALWENCAKDRGGLRVGHSARASCQVRPRDRARAAFPLRATRHRHG